MKLSVIAMMPLLMSSVCGEDQPVGVVDHPELSESSGLAVSIRNPGGLWAHNDSGDGPHLYLISDSDGSLQAKVTLNTDRPFDWEDVCSFQIAGESWLLIGDVGDNLRARGKKTPGCKLLLVREPKVPAANGRPTITWPVAAVIRFDYEDGLHDCESLAVDPVRKQILLLTKSTPNRCGLYQLPLNLFDPVQQRTATRIASPFVLFATAMDVSADARSLVIASPLNALIVRRKPDESWPEAFGRPGQPVRLPPRRQGETICFDRTADWLFLNSEGTNQPLWKIAVPPDSPQD